jgi:alkaline phosphatase
VHESQLIQTAPGARTQIRTTQQDHPHGRRWNERGNVVLRQSFFGSYPFQAAHLFHDHQKAWFARWLYGYALAEFHRHRFIGGFFGLGIGRSDSEWQSQHGKRRAEAAACTASRDYADEIAAQYLDRRIDLLMGGGRKFYTADKRKDKRDLLADYRAAGYAVLQTPEDLRSLGSSSRVLGVFSDSHIPYLVDQVGGVVKPAPTPSLAAMTRAALAQFQRDDNFILQVEGGKVDHGCHSMDIAAAVRELISFDEAIDVALQFQAEHPDTVIVMTTDHATGNPGLNGMGSGYRDSGKLFANIAKIKCSIGEIAKTMKKGKTVEEMAARLKEVTGYEPSSKKLEMLKPFLDDKGVALYDVYKSENAGLSQVLSNYTGVSFTSGNHTSDLIPIVACGPGSEAFQGLVQGPDIFFRYTEFAGIRFKNPQEALVNLAEASGGTENVEEYWQAVA